MAAKIFNARRMTLHSLVELSRGEFESHHITEMEMIILKTLSWRLHPPTVQQFVEAFLSKVTLADARTVACVRQRAMFFAELALYDYNFVPKKNAMIAAACILNAIEGLELEDDPSTTQEYQFIINLKERLGLDLDPSKLENLRHRLWYIYSMSSQYQVEESSPVSKTTALIPVFKTKELNVESKMDLSPVCVIST